MLIPESPTISLSELNAAPSAWFSTLARALARGDEDSVRAAQSRLRDLGWLVLSAADVEQLQQAQEQPEPEEADEAIDDSEPAEAQEASAP